MRAEPKRRLPDENGRQTAEEEKRRKRRNREKERKI